MYYKKIFRLSGLRIIYTIFGLIYSVLQVRFFGTSRPVEVFFVANTVAYLVTSLTQSGQLSEFFLPIYLSIKITHGKGAAYRAFSVLINRFAVFLSLVLMLFYFISPVIVSLMAPGFSENDKELCIKMFRIFLIFLELQFINSFIDVTLNAEKIFGRIEWAAIFNSIIALILLMLFYKALGIWILVVTLFAGKLIEFIITIIFVKKVGIKYSFIWSESSFNANAFFKLMFTTSGYVVSTQIYNMVFTAMATLLPQGTYAIFKYIQQISGKASGILLDPLSTVFFTHFSNHVTSGGKELENKIREPVLYSFILGFAITGCVVLFGRELINVLWNQKNVETYFLAIAYWMLIIYFLAFTVSAVGSIYRKVALSLGKGKILYHFWIATQIITAIISYFLIVPLGWPGLVLIILFNAILITCSCIWVVQKTGLIISKTIDFKSLLSILLSSILFIGISFLLNFLLKSFESVFVIVLIKTVVASLLGFLILFFRHKELYKKLLFFCRANAFKITGNLTE